MLVVLGYFGYGYFSNRSIMRMYSSAPMTNQNVDSVVSFAYSGGAVNFNVPIGYEAKQLTSSSGLYIYIQKIGSNAFRIAPIQIQLLKSTEVDTFKGNFFSNILSKRILNDISVDGRQAVLLFEKDRPGAIGNPELWDNFIVAVEWPVTPGNGTLLVNMKTPEKTGFTNEQVGAYKQIINSLHYISK